MSGGQTGVDRAALDLALELGVPHGGWCPRGRHAEDGPISSRYALRETPSDDPAQRTAWNVRDSEASLVLTQGAPRGGTALTADRARALGRPLRIDDLAAADPDDTRRWLEALGVRVLNVAGPRESERPGIGREAARFLRQVLAPPGQNP